MIPTMNGGGLSVCRFGVRFPCMSDAYDRELRKLAHEVAAELDFCDFVREGVYCVIGGPSFETIAECRMLRQLGADAVGEYGPLLRCNRIELVRSCSVQILNIFNL